MKLQNALHMIAILTKMTPKEGYPFGEAAKDLTEEEAARLWNRYQRCLASGGTFNVDPSNQTVSHRTIQNSKIHYSNSEKATTRKAAKFDLGINE